MKLAAALATFALLAFAPAASAIDPAFAPGPDGEADQALPNAIFVHDACPGDFDGDGNVDVAYPLLRSGVDPSGIVVQRGDGIGHLAAGVVEITQASSDAGDCVAGDWNGDGRDDIAAVDETTHNLEIALGQADGGFTRSTIDVTKPSTEVRAGDINGDGKLDLFLTRISPDDLVPLVGDGTGAFTLGSPLTLPDGTNIDPSDLAVGDINGDHRADAVVYEPTGSGVHPQTAYGMPDGSLQGNGVTSDTIDQAFQATSGALADVDGDGDVDSINNGGAKFSVQLNDGSGAFSSTGGSYPATNLPVAVPSVTSADFNGDGFPDTAAGSTIVGGQPARVFVDAGLGNTAQPFFADVAQGPFVVHSGSGSASVTTADLNNDGRPDIVAMVTAANDSGPAILLNTTPTPGAVTGAASPVADDSALIHGTVAPSNVSTQYGLDLLSETGAVDRKPVAGGVSGSGQQDVTISLTGLTPDTDYRYRLYATNANGTTVGKVKTFRTAVARPANTSPPTIDGTTTLTCGDGSWSGSPALTVQWLRGGVPIAGQTEHTYAVTAQDFGSAVSCRVTATNAGGSASADSPAIVIQPPATKPSNVKKPRLIGKAKVHRTLACTAGTWNAGGTFSYAWLRNGKKIKHQSKPVYVVRRRDVKRKLRCRVTLKNAVGQASARSKAKRARR